MRPRTLYRSIRRHPLILPLYLPTLFIAIAWGVRSLVLPLFVDSFDVSYSMIGIVVGADALGRVMMDIPSGLALRRLGLRRAMLIGVLVAGFGDLALVWARNVPEVLVYRLIAGFGFGLFAIARHAFIAHNVSGRKRGQAVALFGGIIRVGRIVGPIAGGWMIDTFSVRAPFWLTSLMTGLTFLAIFLFVKADLPTPGSVADTLVKTLRRQWTTIQKQRRVLAAGGIGQMLAQVVRTAPDLVIPLFATEILGLDATAAGLIKGVGGALDTAMFYPAGLIMDRLGRKFAIVPSFLLQGIGLALVPLTGGFVSLLMASLLIGFGNGLGAGTMMTLGADLAPPEERGEFLGAWRTIGDSGFLIGPLVGGAFAAAFTLPLAALLMGGLGLLTAFAFGRYVPETRLPGESISTAD